MWWSRSWTWVTSRLYAVSSGRAPPLISIPGRERGGSEGREGGKGEEGGRRVKVWALTILRYFGLGGKGLVGRYRAGGTVLHVWGTAVGGRLLMYCCGWAVLQAVFKLWSAGCAYSPPLAPSSNHAARWMAL